VQTVKNKSIRRGASGGPPGATSSSLTGTRRWWTLTVLGSPPPEDIDASTVVRGSSRGEPTAELVPALTIAAHPDPARVGDRLVLAELAAGGEVQLSRRSPDFHRAGCALGAPLADVFLSRRPIRIAPAPGRRIRIVSDDGTAIAIDGAPRGLAELGPLVPGDGVPIALADRILLVLHLVEPAAPDDADSMGMIGSGLGASRLRRAIAQISDLAVPVLIRGETGTGKELVASALHARGPRRHGPFVSVNLATIPKELAAAELFGAVRGAYTGATRDREGYFRAAHGGTLFLDELGEASPEVPAMLLRVLETGELYQVGGNAPVATDVRVLAATDADLDAQIRDGRFKAPLLHRLAGHELYLPPLRERSEDIGLLFHHFAREELAAIGEADRLAPADPTAEPWLPLSIALRLVRYRWPGNIRQLCNVTRQLVIGSRGQPSLQLEARLAAELDANAVSVTVAADEPAPKPKPPPRRRPAEITEPELIAALRAHAWDLKAAADHLGIPRSSIYDVIARSPNVRTAGDLAPAEIERCHRECAGELDCMAERLEVSRRALRRRLKELGLEIAKAKG
jgi:two-component system nitrogen regulation response regulator GlnG